MASTERWIDIVVAVNLQNQEIGREVVEALLNDPQLLRTYLPNDGNNWRVLRTTDCALK